MEGLGCRLTVACLKGIKIFLDGEEYPDQVAITDVIVTKGLSYSDIEVIQDDDQAFSLAVKKY